MPEHRSTYLIRALVGANPHLSPKDLITLFRHEHPEFNTRTDDALRAAIARERALPPDVKEVKILHEGKTYNGLLIKDLVKFTDPPPVKRKKFDWLKLRFINQ